MNRIREFRKQKNLTMKQLAVLIGVTEGAISHYETGRREPSIELLRKIANALDVPMDVLMSAEPVNTPFEPEPLVNSDVDFQNRLIRVRKDAGMTQAEFGEALGISRGIVAKLETGITPPSKTLLLLLSSKFNVDMGWLETGEGSPYGHQMIPDLVEALKPYPDVMQRLSNLLPHMTVDDMQALTKALKEFIDSLNDEK